MELPQLLLSDNASSATSNPLTEAVGKIGAPTVVSAIPAFAMLCGYLLVCCCRPSRVIQAIFQNLSAGIIIGSVAGELFPLLELDVDSDWGNDVALFVGFVLGMGIMFGLEKLLDFCEKDDDDEDDDEKGDEDVERRLSKTLPAGDYLGKNNMNESAGLLAGATNPAYVDPKKIDLSLDVRAQLRERFTVIIDTLKSTPLTNRDHVDEVVHRVQAFVHAVRRQMHHKKEANSSYSVEVGPDEQAHLQSWMEHLLEACQHLFEHLQSTEPLSNEIKKEILDHVIDLEAELEQAHTELEAAATPRTKMRSQRRWAVLPPQSAVPAPKTPVPWSFVLAVCVDAFVDGFLTGLSFIAKPYAGYIMAGATCIEMGFLGITYSGTLQSSTSRLKLVGICAIPLATMIVGGLLAGIVGEFVHPGTAVFEGLIAFCVVALLFLVTQELLTGANENLEGKEIVWVNMMIFVGILVVMVVERVTVHF